MKYKQLLLKTMNNLLFKNISRFSFSLFIFLLLVFGRNFTGVYVFKYRIGEFIVGLQILLTHYLIIKIKDKNLKFIYFAFLVLFYLKLYYVIFDIQDFYLFRFSSILWATSMFAFGYKFGISKKTYFNLLALSLVFLYILNYVYYPNFLIETFNIYSDKFDFTKPSFLMLVFCLTNFFAFKIYKFNIFFSIFCFSSIFYSPIFINQSRGTFIAILTLLILVGINALIKLLNVRYNIKKILVVFLILSSSSIFLLITNLQETTFTDYSIKSNNFMLELEKVNEINDLLFIDRGFLASSDENINWRLTIWQTTLWDMYQDNLLIFGYPIHKQIPIMQHPYYRTIFLENFNVHNFLIQFFAYFGFVGLAILFLLFVEIFNKYLKLYGSLDLIFLIVPIFIVSFFDSSMESVRFPLIFYYSLGLLVNSKDL